MDMAKQRVFFMIKPDGMALEGKIIAMVRPMARIVSSRLFAPADMRRIERLYEMHKGAFFYERLMNFFRGRDIKVFILEEKNGHPYRSSFLEDFVDRVGDTDPAKARQGTIRSLSTDSLERSIAEERAVNNLVHRSRTLEEADREIAIFFGDLDACTVDAEAVCEGTEGCEPSCNQ